MGVVIGATLPVMLGSVGLAVDVAQWTLAKRSLQRQADSAALAGVYGLSQGADTQASVTRDLALNARYSLDGPPIIERGPSAGPYAGDGRAVRVALAAVLNLPFAGMFITGGARITAESTAALVPTGDVCVLALENTDTAGIFMGGNTTVDMNCAMVTNSVAANAVDTGGSSTVIASPRPGAPISPERHSRARLSAMTHPLADWHAYIKAPDHARLWDMLHPDVVFESPVVHTPQRGRELTYAYLSSADQVLGGPGFRYTGEWTAPGSAVLEFETEVEGISVNGIDMIKWADDGRIIHFKVMVRPLKAINLLHRMMGEQLAKMKEAGNG